MARTENLLIQSNEDLVAVLETQLARHKACPSCHSAALLRFAKLVLQADSFDDDARLAMALVIISADDMRHVLTETGFMQGVIQIITPDENSDAETRAALAAEAMKKGVDPLARACNTMQTAVELARIAERNAPRIILPGGIIH